MASQIIQIVSASEQGPERIKVEASTYEFTIATRAKWEMIVAGEDVTIAKGAFEKIEIREICLQRDLLALLCAFTPHPLASVVRVGSGGGVAPVEADRQIQVAYILGQETGEIKEGDLIGVLNVLPIMFTREAKKPVIVKE
ncbi:MAG: DUF22 domain-containing protein [Euryarchaeota archaeon]|nr:MAG: hypothetical protein C5S47_00540 [ANME-2 cluster archaeon]MEA1865111.1 DUF22 domain-containing protein [Euryarchaeota archaeon]